MQSMGESYELVYVNDGSKDNTENILNDLQQSDENVAVSL